MGEKLLVINSTPAETRIALLDRGKIVELLVERRQAKGIVGNIYKGRVSRVLPGMQSAFIEVGAERTAFLYGGDVMDPANMELKRRESLVEFDAGAEVKLEAVAAVERTPIEKLLKEGDEVLVQVTKEPLGTKGARLTTFVSLPGRYVVLMPDFEHVGISRRIEDETVRESLRAAAEKIRPKGFGIIVRTAGANADPEEVRREVDFLVRQWQHLDRRRRRSGAPSLLYQEPEFIEKSVRDWLSDDVRHIFIDDRREHQILDEFLTTNIPDARHKLVLYEKENPIFDEFGVELDIAKALGRKVWLPSGGYLVVDQTEALTVFDVNTGRFVGKISAKETILKTNLEAAAEIATQLRVRNIGGIIVIDFIDMEAVEDRDQVEKAFELALKDDKAKYQVLKISEFGLVQMTRKRTSESLERQLLAECPTCAGRGRISSITSHLCEMVREIERHAVRTKQTLITIRMTPTLKRKFEEEDRELMKHVVRKHKIKLKIEEAGPGDEPLIDPPYEII